MTREQLYIAISRLRQDGNDAGAIDYWLKFGAGMSWNAFQAIDPLDDYAEVERRLLRKQQDNR